MSSAVCVCASTDSHAIIIIINMSVSKQLVSNYELNFSVV